jgi:hypothetical protein
MNISSRYQLHNQVILIVGQLLEIDVACFICASCVTDNNISQAHLVSY